MVVWIGSEVQHSIPSVSICYGTQSDIRVKRDYCLNWLRAWTFNFERLDIIWDSIRHSRKKVIVIWIGSELQHSISSVSICYGTQSDIRVKSYCRLNLLRGSTFNFEGLDMLRDTIRHPSKNLLSFEFAQNFCFQLRGSWYITELNRTFESKVIVVWICLELLFSITSISIY